MGKYRAVQAE